jgi:hypothetical protein
MTRSAISRSASQWAAVDPVIPAPTIVTLSAIIASYKVLSGVTQLEFDCWSLAFFRFFREALCGRVVNISLDIGQKAKLHRIISFNCVTPAF